MRYQICEICDCKFPQCEDGRDICSECRSITSRFDINPGDTDRAKDIMGMTGQSFRTCLAIGVAINWGGFDGAHHKTWTLDQIVRILSGGNYDGVVKWAQEGDEGPETYEYDEGIAP